MKLIEKNTDSGEQPAILKSIGGGKNEKQSLL
jgi:hypothetical protein